MDGSVSTLAPLFATAGLTGRPLDAFFVGLAASVGAGISMGLAEALSDDGVVSGRGTPVLRGAITGAATTLGGMLHTLPFLLPSLHAALLLAYLVVVELFVIAYPPLFPEPANGAMSTLRDVPPAAAAAFGNLLSCSATSLPVSPFNRLRLLRRLVIPGRRSTRIVW